MQNHLQSNYKTKYTKITSELEQTWLELSKSYLYLDNYDKAMSVSAKVLKYNPNNADAYFVMCQLALTKNDNNKVFEFISKIAKLKGFTHSHFDEDYEINYPTPEEYAIFACTKDPMTYVIEIKIHSQLQVAESIQAVYNYSSDVKLGLHANSLAYYGDIIDELNSMLMKFKVQIHLNLDAPITEEFMTDINFDKSCELRDPVSERTDAAYKILQDKYKSSIGLHLFIWTCPVLNDKYAVEEKFMHDTCGRVMGVLWLGTEPTRSLIMNEIMYSLTGIQGDFSTPAAFNENIQGPLCLYSNKCLARNATDIGQKVFGEKYLRYTDEYDYE